MSVQTIYQLTAHLQQQLNTYKEANDRRVQELEVIVDVLKDEIKLLKQQRDRTYRKPQRAPA